MSDAAILLRWQLLGLRNATAALLRTRGGEVALFGGAALLMLGGYAVSVYQTLERPAPAIRGAWAAVGCGGAGLALGLGWRCGRAIGQWVAERAASPWLVVLPIAETARARASLMTSLAACGALLPLPALCGWGVSHAVAAPHTVLAGPAMALCFAAGFVLAARPGRWAAAEEARAAQPRTVALMWRAVARLDRTAPRYVGLWAQGMAGARCRARG